MIIRFGDIIRPLIDGNMTNYLSCVPNLEHLSIRLSIYDSTLVESFLDYDWCATIIVHCLPLLQLFTLYVYFFNLNGFDETELLNFINQMKENFRIAHNDRYQSRLVIRQP